MATKTLPTIAGGSLGLTRYLEEIRRFPMLEPTQEFMLAKRWAEHSDQAAAHQLVTSHLRLVARIAMEPDEMPPLPPLPHRHLPYVMEEWNCEQKFKYVMFLLTQNY